MADLLLAVKLVLENGQYKAEIVNSEQLTKKLGATGKTSFGELADAAGRAPGPVGALTSRMSSLVSTATLVTAGVTATVAAIGAFVIGVASGTAVAGEHERQLRRLEAQIRATGAAAGKSAEQLDEQSGALARSTLFSDDEIRAAQSRLLTFTSVSGAMFDRALRGATDLASIMEGGLSGAVVALGKALEDPEEGLTALTRAGIKFSDEQQKLIKSLAETGQKGEALAAVLDVIEGKIGGVAAAEAQGYSDAIHDLAEGWEDLLEAIGDTSSFERATRALSNLVDGARKLIAPTDQETFSSRFAQRQEVKESIDRAEARARSAGEPEERIAVALPRQRALLAALDAELKTMSEAREQADRKDGARAEEAEKRRLANQLEDQKRYLAEKAKETEKANAVLRKQEDELREQMLGDDQEALQRSLEARQIALKTEVETAAAELERSRDLKLITDEQYFSARADLVDASYSAEIDLRERLLLIADAKEKEVVTAQIDDLKAKRLRALQQVQDAEIKAQAERLQAIQTRVSAATTRADQGASAVDARVSTGALTPAQGRGALAEIAVQSRTELEGLRAELLKLLETAPESAPLLDLLGQVQGAIRQTRTEAEILGDRVFGTLVDGASDALSEFSNGVKDFDDAFADASNSVVKSITRMVTELLVLAAAQQLVGIFTGGTFTVSGGQITKTQAPVVQPQFSAAGGGFVQGPGGPTEDAVPAVLNGKPARLSNGEFVIRESSVRRFGRRFFEELNAGFAPPSPGRSFATGGFIGGGSSSGSGAAPVIQIINQGEPMKASRTERSTTPDLQDVYRIFVEPQLKRDIASGGDVSQLFGGVFGLTRQPSRR